MKAEEARELSKKSMQDEIILIKTLIEVECSKGNRHLSVSKISEGGYAYFIDSGYEIDSHFSMGKEQMSVVIKW